MIEGKFSQSGVQSQHWLSISPTPPLHSPLDQLMDTSQLSDADTIAEEKNGIENEIDLEGEKEDGDRTKEYD